MENITRIAALVVPLATVTCVAYLFGYWGPLGVNVLEHIDLSDVVRLSLYPLLVSLSSILLGMILGNIIGPSLRGVFKGAPPERHSRIAKLIFWLFWLGNVSWAWFGGQEPYKWVALASLLGILAAPLANTEALRELVPHHLARNVGLSIALLIPSMGFAFGRVNSYNAMQGKAEMAIDASRLADGLALRFTAQKPVLYLGRLGDRIALYETLSRQVVLIRDDQIPVLPLREK